MINSCDFWGVKVNKKSVRIGCTKFTLQDINNVLLEDWKKQLTN